MNKNLHLLHLSFSDHEELVPWRVTAGEDSEDMPQMTRRWISMALVGVKVEYGISIQVLVGQVFPPAF